MALLPDRIMILDGAMGTVLGERGVDLSPPLWSARAIIEQPTLVEQVHREYIEAGADAITTNTFRAHARSLAKAGLSETVARDVVARASELAKRTRDAAEADHAEDVIVLGSVGPLDDCYSPADAPPQQQCADEHRRMISWLCDAGVDGVLIETMGTLREAEAAAMQARELMPERWMISFLMEPGGPPGMLIGGEPVTDLLSSLNGAAAVGVNCVAAPDIEPHIEMLRTLLPETVRIIAYGNTGRMIANGSWENTDAADPARYAHYAEQWIRAGATIIGGCCGTNPDTIRAVAGIRR